MAEKKELSFYEKIIKVQEELKAPKDKTNSFGGYKYRSAESILEAVKPLLSKYGLYMFLTDTVIEIGERYYVKATATISDPNGGKIETSAFAREEETKRGMDGAQITGTASSYARKYALNGILLTDDTKDADTEEYHRQTTEETPEALATPAQIEILKKIAAAQGKEIDEAEVKAWTMKHASAVIAKCKGGK